MKKIIFTLLILVCMSQVQAQIVTQPLSYQDYLRKVVNGNLEYASEKLNVSASQADAIAARVFNDPELSVSYFNNQNNKLKMGDGFSVGLAQTFTLGKRGAAIGMARSEKELSELLLADYFRNLQAEATLTYLESVKQKRLYEIKHNAQNVISKLVEADSIRMLAKAIEVDVIESRLEACIVFNEYLQSMTDSKNSCTALAVMMGTFDLNVLYSPDSQLQASSKDFILSDLIANAIDNRADVVALLKNVDVAGRAVKVARKENIPDVELSMEVGKNSRALNEEAPSPPFTGVTVGVAFPLKFSAMNKGAVNSAKFREQQMLLQYEQSRIVVQSEVLQAFHQYQTLVAQVKHFENVMLRQAKEVFNSKTESYNNEETSLLEFISAQRTYDDVQIQYIETLYNYNVALVNLEKAAGIWDIKL